MDSVEEDVPGMDAQESLLYSARHGELKVVKSLLDARKDNKLALDINCKGKAKSNLGWTPLHLATYFGHGPVVRALLEAGADVDAANDCGDTALHKAAFIGNEELVILLLKHNADINILNGEGRTACDVSKHEDVRRLIEAANRAERVERERRLLTAAKEGRVDEVQELLSSPNPPNINCVDTQGNTSLHCAAYREHARVAVLLLQNGVDTTLRNHQGQLAIELCRSGELREVLSVRPARGLRAARREGPLLRRQRFLGWRPVWAVLQRGVLLYFSSRADAGGGRWRGRKYLDGATVTAPVTEPALIQLAFSDGDCHRLAVPGGKGVDVAAARQTWLTALSEHIAYSEHYLSCGVTEQSHEADTEEDCKPLGSMQDALTSAQNSLSLLDTQLRECAAIVAALDKSANVGNSLHHSAYMIERNRVLEEALAALARTHHALEMSVAEELTKSNRKKKSKSANSINESKESFFDVYEGSDDEDDTLVTAGLSSPFGVSPWGSPEPVRRTPIGSLDGDGDVTPTNASPRQSPQRALTGSGSLCSLRSLSMASSQGTLVSHGGHVYRNARPYRRNTPSSQWSL